MPLIYINGKGDLDLAKRVESFSMLGESVTYNPLASSGITSKKDRIIELRNWTEDNYRKIAEGYLQDIFQILEYFELNIELTTLTKYFKPKALYNLLRSKNDNTMCHVIDALETKFKDISSLVAEIENITKSEIDHLFQCEGKPYLSLINTLDENAIVNFCLQPLSFPT